ncbi:MAG TPA: hypothetical protein VG327_12220 [Mycobacterium sp.]|jgi:hypothetical protein|nr:hypothetical protein [Mycobacterium sp.]
MYRALTQGEPVTDPLYAFDNFVDMIGFPKAWEFDNAVEACDHAVVGNGGIDE